MKCKFTDLPDFIEYFLVEGAVHLEKMTGKPLKELWPDMFDMDGKPKEWDLQVMLNGLELPADKVFKHLEFQMEEFIAKKAVALIKEKYNNIDNLMYEIEQLIIGRIQKDYPKFRLNEEDY